MFNFIICIALDDSTFFPRISSAVLIGTDPVFRNVIIQCDIETTNAKFQLFKRMISECIFFILGMDQGGGT